MMHIRSGASKPPMKERGREFVITLLCCLGVFSGSGRAQVRPLLHVAQTPPSQESDAKALERVLAQMDAAAANFRSAQANFVWEQYTKVVDEKEDQKGTIYYRRQGKEIQMMADLTDPKKSVLFRDGKIQIAQPNLDPRTIEAGKNRETVESFLVLGFGGSGHDLLKQFDVKHLGTETIDGVKTAKLELIPKSEKVRKIFGKIWLWIDPAKGISLQQQFFEDSGSYRLAKYTDLRLDQKIPDSVFKLPNYSDSKHGSGPKS